MKKVKKSFFKSESESEKYLTSVVGVHTFIEPEVKKILAKALYQFSMWRLKKFLENSKNSWNFPSHAP